MAEIDRLEELEDVSNSSAYAVSSICDRDSFETHGHPLVLSLSLSLGISLTRI